MKGDETFSTTLMSKTLRHQPADDLVPCVSSKALFRQETEEGAVLSWNQPILMPHKWSFW